MLSPIWNKKTSDMEPPQSTKPKISLIMAVRNEAKTIAGVLHSLQKQSFTDFELIVSDGRSEDGTAAILADFCRTDPRIHWMENNRCYTSHGLNMGIRAAQGNIIIILSGHAIPAQDFLQESIAALDQTTADCVGGVVIPCGQSFFQVCFSRILSSWFGTGGARFRYSVKSGNVDTVAYGAYRRMVFERIGGFRENLLRNMDIEFNSRLINMGGKVFFSPRIKTYYQVRPTLKSFLGQAFENGAWNIKTTYLVPHSLTWRHFIPLCFTAALFVSAALTILFQLGWISFVSVLFPYSILDMWSSYKGAKLERKLTYAFVLPGLYFLFHLSYGLGSLFSVLAFPWWCRKLRRNAFEP